MNPKNLLLGTLVGAICFFLLGFVFYALLLADFFTNNAGAAQNVAKENPDLLLLFISHLLQALLLTIIFDRWAGIKTFLTGAKAGAVIGLLMGLSYGLIMLATTHITTMKAVWVDCILSAVIMGIGGGVIGLLLGKLSKAER